MKCLKLVIALCLWCATAFSQNKIYKNDKYKWPDAKPETIALNPMYVSEDAVILYENCEIEMMHGNVLQRLLNDVHLTKTIRIKFLTQRGIDKYSTFSLPESFDPYSDNYSRPTDSVPHGHLPKGEFDFLKYFSARIINNDGVVSLPEIIQRNEVESYYLKGYEVGYGSPSNERKDHAIHLTVTNLKPGDELEVVYSLQHIYISNRIFFHGTLPKQKCRIEFKYNSEFDLYFISQFNNATYIDSTNNHKVAKYAWDLTNLPGCISEKNSRPWKELPYIVFYRHRKDFGDINPRTNLIDVYRPYTWQIVLASSATFDEKSNERDELTDRNANSFNRFLTETVADIPDSLPYKKIRAVHDTLVEVFGFQQDDDFYKGIDVRRPRFAEFTDNRMIREISRSQIYTRLLFKLRVPYYTSVLLDKRVEEMDLGKFAPAVTSQRFFCIKTDDQTEYFIPKQHRFGYYLNELPFYYEDVTNLQIPQSVALNGASEYDWKDVRITATKTPYSTLTENTRSTNIKAELNTGTNVLSFEARVTLKGQYSTITRGFYLFGYRDYTVNPLYYTKVWEINKDLSPKWSVITKNNIYPFEFTLKSNYISNKQIQSVNDVQQLSLSGWFPHVVEKDVMLSKRVLPYFVDFPGTDTYRYYIKADKPVQVINAKEYEKNIDTDYFSYVCRITQPQPEVIMIESLFMTKQEKIPADRVNGYLSACKEAAIINSGVLQLRY